MTATPPTTMRPDHRTLTAYDTGAEVYAERRSPRDIDRARRFASRTAAGRRLDLGCGPGLWFEHLGEPLVGLDGSGPMTAIAHERAPRTALVQGSLEGLPFARGAFDGIWANKSLQHVAAEYLALVCADLHRILTVDGHLVIRVFAGDGTFRSHDDLPDRRFTLWRREELVDVLVGAGFRVTSVEVRPGSDLRVLDIEATRSHTLPDFVGPGMRLLVCGLNPSLASAEVGVGFSGPSNRFWKALRHAGLSTGDRDPRALLLGDRVGMTDLVKRATRAARDLDAAEYRDGLDRLRRVVARTRPFAVCLVGLAGWRAVVDRHAAPGRQDPSVIGAPTYVMPSTSGLNAHSSLDDLATHLRRAAS